MANHINLINESLDKIVVKDTTPVLFEDFCEDCSESGVSKEDILDWLYQHEQLVQDCEEHFGQDASWASADELEAFISDHDTAWKDYAEHFDLEIQEDQDSLEESWTKMMFDFKHDGKYDEEALKAVIDKELKRQGLDWTGYVDFDSVDYSGYDLDESYNRFLAEAKISPEDKHDSDLIRSIYAKANEPGVKKDKIRNILTPEEKEVFDKYDLSFGSKASKYHDRDMFSRKRTVSLGRYPYTGTKEAVSNPEVNLADLARKRGSRIPYDNVADWSYRSHNNSDDEIPAKYHDDRWIVRNISDKRNQDLDDFYMKRFGKTPKHESLDSDLSEYQKWVDYDMEKYHRISDITMKKIKKAGLSVVKDQYGEYEVIADRLIKK